MKLNIEIVKTKDWGYSIMLNGVAIMECMSLTEVKETTIADLMIAKEDLDKELAWRSNNASD